MAWPRARGSSQARGVNSTRAACLVGAGAAGGGSASGPAAGQRRSHSKTVRAAGHLFWLCHLLYPRRAVQFPSFSFRECPLRCVSLRHGRKRSSPPRRRPSEPRAGSEREDDSDTAAFSETGRNTDGVESAATQVEADACSGRSTTGREREREIVWSCTPPLPAAVVRRRRRRRSSLRGWTTCHSASR
jgi:hypothetical protein